MIVKVLKGFGTHVPETNILLMFPPMEIDVPRVLAEDMIRQSLASATEVNWHKTPKSYYSTFRYLKGQSAA